MLQNIQTEKDARIFTTNKIDLAEKDGQDGTAKEGPPVKRMRWDQMIFSYFLISTTILILFWIGLVNALVTSVF